MRLLLMECEGACGKDFAIATNDPSGFDFDGFHMVYCCPVCKSFKLNVKGGPWEIDPPKIRIKKHFAIIKHSPTNPKAASGGSASVAGEPEPYLLSLGQLPGSGRGDYEYREGAPEEQKEPIVDGVNLPGTEASGAAKWVNTPEQYRSEEARALGLMD